MSQCVFNENGQSAGRRRHCSLYYPATAPRPWKPPAAKSRINQVGLLMPPNANVPTLVPQPVWCFHVSDTTPMPRKLPAAIRRTIEVGPLQASGGLRPHTVDEPCEGPFSKHSSGALAAASRNRRITQVGPMQASACLLPTIVALPCEGKALETARSPATQAGSAR